MHVYSVTAACRIMVSRILRPPTDVLLLYTAHARYRTGDAVDCYSNDRCSGSVIDTGVTPEECCLLDDSSAHQSGDEGEVCIRCFSKHSHGVVLSGEKHTV